MEPTASLRAEKGTAYPLNIQHLIGKIPLTCQTPSQEYSESEGDTGSLPKEMARLHTIPVLMKEEKIALKVELGSVKVEFNRVKAELNKGVLELWKENC